MDTKDKSLPCYDNVLNSMTSQSV